jgi:hypothetical protein
MTGWALGNVMQIELFRVTEIYRMNAELAVVARSHRNVSVKANRGRHYESVAVVRVFANEIHATRSAKDAW